MEDLFGIVVVIITVVAAMAQKSKQKQARRQAMRPMPVSMAAETPPGPPVPMEEPPDIPQLASEDAYRPAMAPRLQTTMRFAQDTDDLYAGSMNAVTHEGEDPCHPKQVREAPPLMAPMPVEKPGLRLDFSGDNLAQAFVMQEILQRPRGLRK